MNGGGVIRCPRCGQPNERTVQRCVRCGLQRGSGSRPAGPPAGGPPRNYQQQYPPQAYPPQSYPPQAYPQQPYGNPGQAPAPRRGQVGPAPVAYTPQQGGPQGPPPGEPQGPPQRSRRGRRRGQQQLPPQGPEAQAPADWAPTSAGPAQDGPGRRFDTAAAIAKTGLRSRSKTPDPAAPERVRTDTEVPAPMLRRVGSTGLDTLLCTTLVVLPFWRVYQLDGSWWPPVILLLGVAAVVLVTVLRARSGRSLFSGAFGLRTVTGGPGEPGRAPGLRAILRRELVSVGAFFAAGASIWSARLDPTGQRRTWQDRAAGTRVIDTRWGADPLEKQRTSSEDEDMGTDEGVAVMVAPLPRPHRTAPGVLDSGLDMTPAAGAVPGGGAGAAWSGAARGGAVVAVIDAAERAAGKADPDPAPVIVVDTAAERIAVMLVSDTGRSIALARSALLGRDPAAAPGEAVEHLVALQDPDRTVSKTHLRIDVAEHGVTVVDRGSSNGTVAVIGGVEHALEPGVALGIPVGTVLRLGERTVTVEAP